MSHTLTKNQFNRTFKAKDTKTYCAIEIKSNGKVYLLEAILSNGEKVNLVHHNTYNDYQPRLRDIIREKIEFSLELSIEHLKERMSDLINKKGHLFEDKEGSREVISSCISYLSDFPISSINEYIHEVRVESESLVFANSVLKNGNVLGRDDREIISNELKETPARFDFPGEYKILLSALETKINFLLANKY